jgi:hypothetical protein
MNVAGQLFFGRLHLSAVMVGLMFALSTLTLLFSMIVASRLAGGIDFGSFATETAKGAALLAVVTALNFVSFGLFLEGRSGSSASCSSITSISARPAS